MSEIVNNNTLYNESAIAYPHDHRGVKWSSKSAQFVRFQVLCDIHPELFQSHIIDVGCGLGHLVDYLKDHHFSGEYLGIDWANQMILEAKKRHPHYRFENTHLDLFSDNAFDYALASGIFAFSNWSCVQSTILALYRCAKKGVAFNVLKKTNSNHYQKEGLFCLEPNQVISFCQEITPFVTCREDYLEDDFTLYLVKDPNHARNGF